MTVGGRFRFRAIDHAHYDPQVTINAPDDATAQQYEVGFVQNLLTENLFYIYSNGNVVISLMPTPIKDGLARTPLTPGGGGYNSIFVTDRSAGTLEGFTVNGDTRNLQWPDTPSDGAPVNVHASVCGAGVPAGTLTHAVFNDTFRIWLVVRHVPSGCVTSLHHVDWELDLSADIDVTSATPVTVLNNEIHINEADGDGSPGFIQGGQVANDFVGNAFRQCV